MKLALNIQEEIGVLTGSGELSARDLEVLRAGVSKLLRSGRNRIVLELPEAEKLPPELIRELSKFDLVARELSGRVVLAGTSETLRKQVKQFAQPPIIQCFDSLQAAIQHLTGSEPPATPAVAPTLAPAAPDDAAADKSKAATQARQPELGELGQLRKRIVALENENEQLQNHLRAALSTQSTQASEGALKLEGTALRLRIDELLALVKGGKEG